MKNLWRVQEVRDQKMRTELIKKEMPGRPGNAAQSLVIKTTRTKQEKAMKPISAFKRKSTKPEIDSGRVVNQITDRLSVIV